MLTSAKMVLLSREGRQAHIADWEGVVFGSSPLPTTVSFVGHKSKTSIFETFVFMAQRKLVYFLFSPNLLSILGRATSSDITVAL